MGLQGMRKRLLLPCISSRWTKTAVMMSAGLVRSNESQCRHKFSTSYCTPTEHTVPRPLCLPTSDGLAWRELRSQWQSFSYVSAPLVDQGSGVGVRLIIRSVFCIIVGFLTCMERCDVYSSFLLRVYYVLGSHVLMSVVLDSSFIPIPLLRFIFLSGVIWANLLGVYTFIHVCYRSG